MILPAFGGRERVGVDPRKVNGDNKDSIVKAAEIMHSYSFYFKTEVNWNQSADVLLTSIAIRDEEEKDMKRLFHSYTR